MCVMEEKTTKVHEDEDEEGGEKVRAIHYMDE